MLSTSDLRIGDVTTLEDDVHGFQFDGASGRKCAYDMWRSRSKTVEATAEHPFGVADMKSAVFADFGSQLSRKKGGAWKEKWKQTGSRLAGLIDAVNALA